MPDLRGDHNPAAVARQVPTDIERTILIGHSGAGPMLPAIADALGTTTAVIYVDAGLPRPGLSAVDTQPAGPTRWTGAESYLLLSEGYRAEAERLRAAGPPVVELLSDHLAPLTRPAEVAAALIGLLDTPLVGLVFGQHAETYDEVRPEYPGDLVDEALAYAGNPDTAVEVGAGTGKATALFAVRKIGLTCVEPDPAMAAILRRRFPQVSIVDSRFEDWTPPAGGVPLLYFALSWHWADPTRRAALAHAALRPGGTLALLDHAHGFADPELEQRLNSVYEQIAPQLRAEPRQIAAGVVEERTRELVASGLFGELHSASAVHDIAYPTRRYLDLLRTFSSHIALSPARRDALYQRIGEVADAAGGVVIVRLVTTLILARSRVEPRSVAG